MYSLNLTQVATIVSGACINGMDRGSKAIRHEEARVKNVLIASNAGRCVLFLRVALVCAGSKRRLNQANRCHPFTGV